SWAGRTGMSSVHKIELRILAVFVKRLETIAFQESVDFIDVRVVALAVAGAAADAEKVATFVHQWAAGASACRGVAHLPQPGRSSAIGLAHPSFFFHLIDPAGR